MHILLSYSVLLQKARQLVLELMEQKELEVCPDSV